METHNTQYPTSILAGVISVGTPPQYITVQFDFHSNDFFVLDVQSAQTQTTESSTSAERVSNKLEGTAADSNDTSGTSSTAGLYDPSASTTANPQPFYANSYFATGNTVQDVMGLGSNFTVNVTVGDATTLETTYYFYGYSFTYLGYGTINGTIGMNVQYNNSLYMESTSNVTSIVDQIAAQDGLTDAQKWVDIFFKISPTFKICPPTLTNYERAHHFQACQHVRQRKLRDQCTLHGPQLRPDHLRRRGRRQLRGGELLLLLPEQRRRPLPLLHARRAQRLLIQYFRRLLN